MKTLIAVIMVVGQACLAQTTLNKSFPVGPGQKINLHFDYPELVKISSWDKNEVVISGTVLINNGENDDAFILSSVVNGDKVDIKGEVANMKSLPRRITIYRDGQKITFKTRDDYNRYVAEKGGDYNMMSTGVDIDITLEIKVPRNQYTIVHSTYGMVEVRNFEGPLQVSSTYGGVDASLNAKTIGELSAETNYGQIYSNLDVKFLGGEVKNFHTLVTAKPGSGPTQSFESKYGNVYLRKAL